MAIQYSCKWCSFKCFVYTAMVTHYKADHLNYRQFRCLTCDYSSEDLGKLTMHNHVRQNRCSSDDSGHLYKCSECPWASMNYHSKVLHAEYQCRFPLPLINGRYKCNFCPQKHPLKKKILSHIRRQHGGGSEIRSLAMPPGTEHSYCKNTDTLYFCALCSYETFNRFWLGRHILSKHR